MEFVYCVVFGCWCFDTLFVFACVGLLCMLVAYICCSSLFCGLSRILN